MFNFNRNLFFKINNKSNNLKINLVQKSCNSLECLIKNNKKINSVINIPFLEQSIHFQLEFLKELEGVKYENFRNLSIEEINLLKDFIAKRPIKVVELDKNVGAGLISNELYEKKTFDLLNDSSIYERIEENPLADICKDIENKLSELLDLKDINEKIYISLLPVNSKIGSFRILPKIHKD